LTVYMHCNCNTQISQSFYVLQPLLPYISDQLFFFILFWVVRQTKLA